MDRIKKMWEAVKRMFHRHPKTTPVTIPAPAPAPMPTQTVPTKQAPAPKPAPIQTSPSPSKPVPTAPKPMPTVAKSLLDTTIKYGVATKEGGMITTDKVYQDFLKSQFRSFTPENAAKWGHVHPDKDKWSTKDLDALIAFAKPLGARIHGHCFFWGVDVPKYIKGLKDSKVVAQLMKDHVFGMVDRFGKDIHSWDVTNEALGDNGKLKSSFFYNMFGDEYIPMAYDFAHQADPSAKLFFSEYGLETNSLRTPGLLTLLDQWKKAGVPIHGISSQTHTVARLDMKIFGENLKKFAATGLLFHISELDITVGHGQGANTVKDEKGTVITLFPFTPELQQLSANAYAGIVSAYKENMPVAQQYGITLWSATHDQNYMNQKQPTDYPSLWKKGYAPEIAYKQLLKI